MTTEPPPSTPGSPSPADAAALPAGVTPAPEPAPAAPRPAALAVLGVREFRLLVLMQLASGMRQPMLFFTQAWYVNLAAPESQRVLLLGLLGAVRGGVYLSYVAFGGAIADRFPRRRTLIVSHSIALALATGVALLLYVPAVGRGEGPWLWVMMALFASFGLITGQDQPTRTAMLRDAVPQPMLVSAVTLHQFAMALAFLFAAPISGLAIERLGFATTYLASGVGHVVVLAAALAMRAPSAAADPEARGESVLQNLRAGFAVLRDDPVVRWTVYLTWLVLAAGLSVMGILIAAWVRDVLGLDAAGWGWMALFWGLGGITASSWLVWRGEDRHKGALFLAACGLMGVAVFAFGLSRAIPPAFLFNGLAGLANTLVLTIGIAIVQQSVPNRVLGRVTALLMLSQGLMQVAGLGVGALGQVVGLEVVYPAAGLVIVAATVAAAVRQRPLRTMP